MAVPQWHGRRSSLTFAAGLDLCLHIVRTDHGSRVANDVARRLVISPHRAGGQSQYIESPVPEPSTDGQIADQLAPPSAHHG